MGFVSDMLDPTYVFCLLGFIFYFLFFIMFLAILLDGNRMGYSKVYSILHRVPRGQSLDVAAVAPRSLFVSVSLLFFYLFYIYIFNAITFVFLLIF